VPESLLESELFGHERGAFSGAVRARTGYFREADGGTLFLDEVGDMSPAQQAKLLRALESGEIIPVGSEQPIHVDVRLVAATNQDLEELTRTGKFREDLLFRIDTVRLELPPLRERRDDIPLLAAHFLERLALTRGVETPSLSKAAMRCLLDHTWPGNVRELAHAIEHAVLVASGATIEPEDLPGRVTGQQSGVAALAAGSEGQGFREARTVFERAYFREIIKRADDKVSLAARLAGIHRATFHKKLRQLGIDSSKLSDEDE